MGIVRRLLFGVGLAALSSVGFLAPSVYADTQSRSGVITVTGVVPPAKYVYVDSGQNITRIISNTPSDAEPVFLRDSSPPGVLIPTKQLLGLYENLKAHNNFRRLGTVYDSSLKPMTAIGLQASLSLAAISPSANLSVISTKSPSLLSLAD